MKAGIHVILGAAVVTAILSISLDARAWGRSYHGYGHHYGHGRYYEYRRHFGYPYHYGRSTILYGRSYHGNRHYSGGAYGTPRPVQPEPNNGSSVCRQFTRIVIDGEEQTAYGMICRQGDGSRTIVN